jgi:MFS family permease
MEKSHALKFIVMFGLVSLFADFAYEGSRSITGPYLAHLGANGAEVGIVAGFGELLGYVLRLASGRLSERTGKFWPITLFGYVIQMTAVPALALAGSWPAAALLIVVERIGKATRNPPRDVMLSHAAKEIGLGLAFGIHEAMDQAGALIGPLAVAAVLAAKGSYQMAFAVLLIPAGITLALLFLTRLKFPKPEGQMESTPDLKGEGLPRVFWVYLAGAALVAAGFSDFSLMSYHFAKAGVVSANWIPVFYAVAMGTSGAGSLAFGKLFDKTGIIVLVPLTIIATLFAPLSFMGGSMAVLAGCALWGMGMGVHESIIPAAVAAMVPVQRRPSAYGIFTAGYGVFWFLGSAVSGFLYDISIPALVAFSMIAQLASIPFFLWVKRHPADAG